MIKLQKIASLVMMSAMLVAGLAGVSQANAAIPSGSLGQGELGLEYPASTGLSSTDVRITVSRIIRVAMGLLGIIAVVIILIGGFTWMTAGGQAEKVEQAKQWIFAGIIGLAIILSAYAIASFVITQLYQATSDAPALG
jgi:Type IV secretion system pilin